MKKEDEIEDSLRFCRELRLHPKSGGFGNPRNVYGWEQYIPLAREEVAEKYKEETAYQNQELEEAVRFSKILKDAKKLEEDGQDTPIFYQLGVSSNGTITLEPVDESVILNPEKRKKRQQEDEDEEDEDDEDEEEESFLKVILVRLVEVVVCIALAFGISAGVNKFVGTHTMVEGSSMESTLHNGDYLLVDKLSYRFGEPKRFDIIIFPYSESTYYIKRIIGLPGERIQIMEGNVYVNGQILSESYGLEPIADGGICSQEIVIGENQYFVLGDNRNHSTDSRSENVGMIQGDDIVGKAFFRFYPFDNLGKVE